MNLFKEYLDEITTRKQQGLSAKPIDNGDLAREIIAHIKSIDSKYHDECVDFLKLHAHGLEEQPVANVLVLHETFQERVIHIEVPIGTIALSLYLFAELH